MPTRALTACLLFWALLFAAPIEAAIELRSSDLKLVENVYELDADFDIQFNKTLEDALSRGIALNFVVEFEVTRPRAILWDEAIAAVELPLRLRYHALTRQYQLTGGFRTRNFATLEEARHELGRITAWPVLDGPLLKKRYAYSVGVRMRLDLFQLPKSLQATALFSRDWSLDSGWHVWEVAP